MTEDKLEGFRSWVAMIISPKPFNMDELVMRMEVFGGPVMASNGRIFLPWVDLISIVKILETCTP